MFAGSLAAILALAGIAAWLKLGGDPIDERAAIDAAEAALVGFDADAVLLAKDGSAALVRGRAGRVALVKRHGAQGAVRLLTPPFAVEPAEAGARIDSRDRMFGAVVLAGCDATTVARFLSAAEPDRTTVTSTG